MWNDGQSLRVGIAAIAGNRRERRAGMTSKSAPAVIPAPRRPIAEMTSAVEVDLYRKEVGAFIQTVIQRLRAAPPDDERAMLAAAQQRAVVLTKALRARANELVAAHGTREGTPDGIALRGAVNIIRDLLEIIDRAQDAGFVRDDAEIRTLNGAAGWMAKYGGEEPVEGDDGSDE